MIDEQGRVTNIIDGKLAIEVTTPGACESCPVHGNCYASGRLVWVPARDGIRINDHVRFSISNTSVLKISALIYGIPFAAVIGGILLGYLWLFRSFADDPKTLVSFGLGVLFFAAAGFAVSRLDRGLRNKLVYTIVRSTPSEDHSGDPVPPQSND